MVCDGACRGPQQMTCGCWPCLPRLHEWGVHQAWLLALIPDYLCQSNPAAGKKKKLAEERGLFDGGGGLWRDVEVRTHTYMFINITHALAKATVTKVQRCILQPQTGTRMQLRSTLSSVAHTWACHCKRLTLPSSSSLSFLIHLPLPSISLPAQSARGESPLNILHHRALPHDSYRCACCTATIAIDVLHFISL